MKELCDLIKQAQQEIIIKMESFGNLLEEVHESLRSKFPRLYAARKELIELVLSKSYFGDKDFFRCYGSINRNTYTGNMEVDLHGNIKKCKWHYCYDENEESQALIRINERFASQGPQHIAFVKEAETINIYMSDMGIGGFYFNRQHFDAKKVPEYMDKYSIDDIAGYSVLHEIGDARFINFCQAITGATTLVLEKFKSRDFDKEYLMLQENIKKLRTVANLDSKKKGK